MCVITSGWTIIYEQTRRRRRPRTKSDGRARLLVNVWKIAKFIAPWTKRSRNAKKETHNPKNQSVFRFRLERTVKVNGGGETSCKKSEFFETWTFSVRYGQIAASGPSVAVTNAKGGVYTSTQSYHDVFVGWNHRLHGVEAIIRTFRIRMPLHLPKTSKNRQNVYAQRR